MDPNNEPMQTVGVVTQSSKKLAQEKGNSQVPPKPVVTSESEHHPESQLTTNTPQGTAPTKSAIKSKVVRHVVPNKRRRKRSKRASKHAKTSKQSEESAKPVRLHLLDVDDLEAQVRREDIKRVSEKESVFGAPSLELRTVLKILQESDQLAQEERSSIDMRASAVRGLGSRLR